MRIVVIGGGIAGVTAAAHLAPAGQVTLLEAESSLAYHTTGRSAATFLLNYGGEAARPLAAASLDFLQSPPEPFVDAPLLSTRGVLWVADHDHLAYLDQVVDAGRRSGAGSERIDVDAALAIVDRLDPRYVAGAIWEPVASDIDVAGLHQAFVRMARSDGADILVGARVVGLSSAMGHWSVRTESRTIECDVVVNAAGAWGDRVAGLAGIEPVGLTPMRRTAFMVPGSDSFARWPLVVDAGEQFYFRPDGVQLLCSLAEEVPDDPGDPKPRIEDVALAIERINNATTLDIRSVSSEWTGLRTFAPDRHLVIGEEPTAPGFFWLVGQGGMGIATAPGYGTLVASQVRGEPVPPHLTAAGVDPALTDPARFRS
jgi:D-arginine dehydrogenase